jgi:hypothetical protein
MKQVRASAGACFLCFGNHDTEALSLPACGYAMQKAPAIHSR